MANIRQKNGSKRWTATVRIPKDIRELNPESIRKRNGEPKTLLEKALGTSDKKLAKKLAHDFEYHCTQQFEKLRLRHQNQLPTHKQFTSAADQIMEEAVAKLRQRLIDAEENPYAEEDANRARLAKVLDNSGEPVDKDTLALYQQTVEGISEAEVDNAIEMLGAKHLGTSTFSSLNKIEEYKRRAKDTRISVGTIFERYIRKRVLDGQVKASTIKRANTTFNEFCESLPFRADTAAATITTAKVREWVGKYQLKLQAQNKAFTTIKNNIESIAPAFNRAEEEGLIDRNPFRKFTEGLFVTKRGVKENESNRSWINDDLNDNALLHLINAASQKFTPQSRSPAHKVMMPLIGLALYTGARIEELCRLTPNDIKLRKHLGVRYIDITAAKSAAGIREIPLLPVAEQIIDYLISQTTAGQDYLLPNLIEQDGRRSHKPSNEFSRFKKKLGYVQKNEYTFHSFRSTAITLLDRANVNDAYISMMVGHVEGRNTLAKKRYSAGPQLAQLKDAVSAIRYGDAIDNLIIQSLRY